MLLRVAGDCTPSQNLSERVKSESRKKQQQKGMPGGEARIQLPGSCGPWCPGAPLPSHSHAAPLVSLHVFPSASLSWLSDRTHINLYSRSKGKLEIDQALQTLKLSPKSSLSLSLTISE